MLVYVCFSFFLKGVIVLGGWMSLWFLRIFSISRSFVHCKMRSEGISERENEGFLEEICSSKMSLPV